MPLGGARIAGRNVSPPRMEPALSHRCPRCSDGPRTPWECWGDIPQLCARPRGLGLTGVPQGVRPGAARKSPDGHLQSHHFWLLTCTLEAANRFVSPHWSHGVPGRSGHRDPLA
eukprot:scaffold127061_cov32-Tisochrysis_lutea.AAC.2